MELTLARKLWTGLVGGEEEKTETASVRSADGFYFNESYLNRSVEIEGFGKVEITPEGPIRINSEQLKRLKEYEAQEGLPVSESKLLEDGTFLVSLKKG